MIRKALKISYWLTLKMCVMRENKIFPSFLLKFRLFDLYPRICILLQIKIRIQGAEMLRIQWIRIQSVVSLMDPDLRS